MKDTPEKYFLRLRKDQSLDLSSFRDDLIYNESTKKSPKINGNMHEWLNT
jgi:hypothetical protein